MLANMVVGANGATSLHRDSAPLSPPADRKRFHEIRAMSKALVVGGNTYRQEHYARAPLPVYVATRRPGPNSGNTTFMNATPSQVVARALAEIGSVILVEGGISFLKPLLENCEIDRLFLTRSPINGDNDFFDFELLRKNYEIAVSKKIDDITFEEWILKNHKL